MNRGDVSVYNTFKNLLPVSKLCEYTDDMDIVEAYKKTQNPAYFAKMFCKHFGMINLKSNSFNCESADKCSLALSTLHTTMLKYDGVSAKFLTYYMSCFNNALINNLKSSYTRQCVNISYDDYEVLEDYNSTNRIVDIEFLLTIDSLELSYREKTYIKFVLSKEKYNDREIANFLNVSSAAVHYIKARLQKKLGIMLIAT